MQPQLAVIADDLTGGLDTGVAFASRGWRTVLRTDSQPSAVSRRPSAGLSDGHTIGTDYLRLTTDDCDAIVWDTETRHASDEEARRIVSGLCEHPSLRAVPRVYKKIDSTLRGPWLAELREVWQARAPLTTLLCPAFPAVGRTLADGELRVYGQSLADAGFSGSGRLRDLLIERWCGRVVSLSVSQLSQAPLFDEAREPWLLLADAESDDDLDTIATRLRQLDQDRLLCGAGGLAAAWARVLIPEPQPLPPAEPVAGPIWIVAGSQHAATRAQMEALAGTAECHVERFEAHTADFGQRLRDLPECAAVALTLTSSSTRCAGTRHLITPSFAAWAAECLGAIAAEASARGAGAFIATGGETAALLLRVLGAAALEIDRELLPGIPLCRIANGPWAGTALVTKAGGFGSPDALARTLAVIRVGGAVDRE